MAVGQTRKTLICVGIVTVLLPAASLPGGMAAAQNIGASDLQDRRGETVLNRSRPDYDAPGVVVGGFIVRARLTEEVGFNDNVTSAHASPEDSVILNSTLVASVASRWQRHAAALSGEVRDYRHFGISSQDYTNWNLGPSLRYDIARDWRVYASYRHSALHEDLDDPNAQGADVPIRYTTDVVRLGTRYSFNRMYVQPFAFLLAYRYDDGEFPGGTVSQAYRDRNVWLGRLEVGYEFSPGRTVFVAGNVSRADYINTPAPGVARFDNNTYEITGGLDYDSDGVWNYRISAGLRHRAYDDSTRNAVNGLALDARVTWRASPITTISAAASTAIEDGTSQGDGGYRENLATVGLDHEYLRNVLLFARGRMRQIDYVSEDRDTVQLSGAVGMDYLINRTLRVGATYEHTRRFGDRERDEFDRNVLLFRMSLGL